MLRTLRIAILFHSAVLASCCSESPGSNAGRSSRSAVELDDLLAWLPGEARNMIVIQEPFKVPPSQSRPAAEEFDASMFHDFVLWPLFAGLIDAHAPAIPVDMDLRMAASSAAEWIDFRIGVMQLYRGTHIYVFATPIAEVLWNRIRSRSTEVSAHDGLEVLHIRTRDDKQEWLWQMVRPDPCVIICSTDTELLDESLDRMRVGRSAVWESWPQRKYLDPRSPFWAIRHYRNYGESPDQVDGPQNLFGITDPGAIGWLFQYAAGDPRKPELIYVSTGAKAYEVVRDIFRRDYVEQIQISNDAVRTRHDDSRRGDDGFYFKMFVAIGHAPMP
jgi:hypothetical protein